MYELKKVYQHPSPYDTIIDNLEIRQYIENDNNLLSDFISNIHHNMQEKVLMTSPIFTVNREFSSDFTSYPEWINNLEYIDRDGDVLYHRMFKGDKKMFTNAPKIKKIIHNDPATIVIFDNDDKSIVKVAHDENMVPMEEYDEEKGIAMALCKYYLNNLFGEDTYSDVFRKDKYNG